MKLREDILRELLGFTFLLEELEAEKKHILITYFQGDAVISTAMLVVKQGLQDSACCDENSRKQGILSIDWYARDSAVNIAWILLTSFF